MKSTTAPTPSDSLDGLDWRAWLLWTLACAATPVLYAIARMAFAKDVSTDAPYWGLVWLAALALALAAALAPTLLQWRVLRRLAPGLKLANWALALFWPLAMFGVLAMFFLRLWDVLPHQWLVQPLMQKEMFESDVNRLRADGVIRLSEILDLPWLLLLLAAGIKTALLTFEPSRLLGRVLQRPAYIFWLAAIAGAYAAAVFEQFYNLCLPRLHHDGSLNGLPWLTRLAELGVRAGIGAVWGSASITAFAVLARRAAAPETLPRHAPRPLALFTCTLALALALPAFAYFFSVKSVRSKFPALVKFFSESPVKEQSSGESVLSYAGNAQFSPPQSYEGNIEFGPPQFPVVNFSPDGRSFFALNAERELRHIDLASGADLGQIAEKLAPNEQFDHAWSPDANVLALRTDGEEVSVAEEKYSQHQNRFRLFEFPQRRVLGEFSFQGGECFQAHGEAMTFEKDGKSLWVRCAQYYSRPAFPASVMAIRLSVPSMNVLEIRRYGEHASVGTMGGMTGAPDGVIYWQSEFMSHKLLQFRNLTLDSDMFSLRDLDDPTQTGKLVLQNIFVKQQRLTILACGTPSDVSNPADQDRQPAAGHSFCRKLFSTHAPGRSWVTPTKQSVT